MKPRKDATPATRRVGAATRLLKQYGCGPIKFSGTDNALYERHLLFDNVVKLSAAGDRERFEAAARSIRDVLSQRWLLTERTYDRENPKRVYYLSMEFLIGRSLANNVTEPDARAVRAPSRCRARRTSTGSACSSRSPTPGWATAGSAGWRPASSIRWPPCRSRPSAMACATNTACFARRSRTAGRSNSPTTGCAGPTPGKLPARNEKVEVSFNCSFEMHGGALRAIPGRPSTCSASRTIARWSATAARRSTRCGSGRRRRRTTFDFQRIQQRRFRRRAGRDPVGRIPHARPLSRRLHRRRGRGCASPGIFPGRCSLADIVRRFRRGNADWSSLPDKVAIQLNDTHPALAVAELMRILLDEAKLDWDQAWDSDAADAGLHQPHAAAGGPGEMAGAVVRRLLPRHLEIIFEINRRFLDDVRAPFPGR